MAGLFSQLRRRNVFRVAGLYAVVGWLLTQIAATMESSLNLPAWFDSVVVSMLLLGFPVALVLAWAFELTPDGVKRSDSVEADASIRPQTGKRLDYGIFIGLLVVAALMVWSWWRVPTLAPELATQSFEDVIAEIASESAGSTPDNSIAVLPFADMSASGDQEYFSDGIAEEILNALVRVPQLKVSGRTSSFAFKGRNIDLREIGAALGVATVLEGSVRKQGERVRITAQLIRTEDGFHLWSETFDGTLEDIFDLQDRIARNIASELQPLFTVSQDARLVPRLTQNKQAYDLFLQGRALVNKLWGESTLTSAVELLEEAIALDPAFLDAKAMLATANALLPQYVIVPDEAPYLARALTLAEEVLAVNPEHSEALVALSSLEFVRGRFLAGMRLVRSGADYRAGADDQKETLSFGESSWDFIVAYRLAVIGHTQAAIRRYELSIAGDPSVGVLLLNYANALAAAGRTFDAERMARRAEAVGFAGAAPVVSEMLKRRGEVGGAESYCAGSYEKMRAYVGEVSEASWLIYCKGVFGDDNVSFGWFRSFVLGQLDVPELRVGTPLLNGLLVIGEPELFMETWERYRFANNSFVLTLIWDDNDNAKAVRQHPEFSAWAKRIGLVEVWKEYGPPDLCKMDDEDQIVCD